MTHEEAAELLADEAHVSFVPNDDPETLVRIYRRARRNCVLDGGAQLTLLIEAFQVVLDRAFDLERSAPELDFEPAATLPAKSVRRYNTMKFGSTQTLVGWLNEHRECEPVSAMLDPEDGRPVVLYRAVEL